MQIITFISISIIIVMGFYILKLNRIKEGKSNKGKIKNERYEKKQSIELIVDTNIRNIFMQARELESNYNNNNSKRRKLQYIRNLTDESIKLLEELKKLKVDD